MNEEKMDPIEEALSKARLTVVKEDFSDFGTYVWIKANGKAFSDGNGNVLSIEAYKNDHERVKKLMDAAAYYGEAEGQAVFYPNTRQISDETHSEQVDRMKQGYIPNMNDLGALIAAKKTLDAYGDEG